MESIVRWTDCWLETSVLGKTEVAMRAAFKAVNDHKQVAVPVPTTVLAQQRYERFESFAVELLF